MPIKCVKIKIASGQEHRVREWAEEVKKYQDEALEALREEGVSIEYAFVDEAEDATYLIYVIKADDLKKSREISVASERYIDQYHQTFQKECWVDGKKLECILELEQND